MNCAHCGEEIVLLGYDTPDNLGIRTAVYSHVPDHGKKDADHHAKPAAEGRAS